MGIREEIEKLQSHFVIGLQKAEVLAILDKWECVAEFPLDVELRTTKHLAGQFMDEETLIDVITDQRKFKLGDHIIILRRNDGHRNDGNTNKGPTY